MPQEPKPRKGKREIEWGSPRHYQEAQRQRNPNTHPHKAGRRAVYCKRLKGPHQWGLKERHTFTYQLAGDPQEHEMVWYTARCIACGKKQSWAKEPNGG